MAEDVSRAWRRVAASQYGDVEVAGAPAIGRTIAASPRSFRLVDVLPLDAAGSVEDQAAHVGLIVEWRRQDAGA